MYIETHGKDLHMKYNTFWAIWKNDFSHVRTKHGVEKLIMKLLTQPNSATITCSYMSVCYKQEYEIKSFHLFKIVVNSGIFSNVLHNSYVK